MPKQVAREVALWMDSGQQRDRGGEDDDDDDDDGGYAGVQWGRMPTKCCDWALAAPRGLALGNCNEEIDL